MPPPPNEPSNGRKSKTEKPVLINPEQVLKLLGVDKQSGATLYAAFRLLADHNQYFKPVGGSQFQCRSVMEVMERMDVHAQQQKYEQRLQEFIEHVQDLLEGREDAEYDIRKYDDLYFRLRAAALQLHSTDSVEVRRVLEALNMPHSPSGLYRLAVRLGFWREGANPHLIRTYDEFSHEGRVIASAEELCANPAPWQDSERWDLRKYPSYAIDQEGAHEIDDAISLVAQPSGQWVVVHVADPTAFIPVGSSVDLAARNRSASVFSVDMHLGMYPPAVLDACSFREEGVDRCAFSVGFFIDTAGQLTEFRMSPSLIRPTRKSFVAVDEMLSRSPSANLDVAAMHKLRQLAQLRAEFRGLRHDKYLDWEKQPARTLVREFMITAGTCAASAAKNFRVPIPYCDSTLTAMPKPSVSSTPIAELKGAAYTRFTSPLRRYWDVLVHYQLRAALRNEQLPFSAMEVRDIAAEAYLKRVQLSHIEYSANRFRVLYSLWLKPRSTVFRVFVQTRRTKAVASDRYSVYLPSLDFTLDDVGISAVVNNDTEYAMKIDLVDPFRGALRLRLAPREEPTDFEAPGKKGRKNIFA